MDKNYLLTYSKDGYAQFDWFETVEEMQTFIDNNRLDGVFEALHIKDSTEVDFDFSVLNK